MKINRFLLVGLIVAILGVLVVGFASPIFARGLDGGGTTPSNGEVWEEMHQACENDDYEAMAEAAEEAHGDDFDHMPYHDEDNHAHHWWGGMGGHMGGMH